MNSCPGLYGFRGIATGSCDSVGATGSSLGSTQLGVALAPAQRFRLGGRGPKVRAAVLAATLAELADKGYAALTIDSIARRAGIHKTTIYRRGEDREKLGAEVLGEPKARGFPIPDTRGGAPDLREPPRSLVGWVTSPTGRMIFAAVYSDAARIPGISDVRRDLFDEGPRRAAPVIERAVARGELPGGTDAAAVLRALVAPIYFRLEGTGQ